jgi:peptide/nickel transport system substrate-binding protein/oligopeptide transport system substrate-binding protein
MSMHARRIIALLTLLFIATGAFAQDDEVFTVNFLRTEVGFDPLVSYTTTEAQIYTGIYEGLVTYDPYSLDPLPAAASRWEISNDGTVYRFTIRSAARYSNGDPVLARHFRDAWLAMLSPETDAAYASLLDIVAGARDFRTGANPDPDSVGIRAVSDRVLEVELETRATHFLRILCHHSFVAVHPDMLRVDEWNENRPLIGNGPYVIQSYENDEMVLTRSEYYWDRRNVDVPTVRITFSDEYESVTEEFNRGEITWVRGGIDLDTVRRRQDIVVNPLFATTYYQFSAARPPFDDSRVRRALVMLLPWEEIRSEEYQYLPATTLVPPIPFYPQVEGIVSADRAKALELLEEAGFPDGRGLPEIAISIPGGVENDRIAAIMEETWEEALEVEVTAETIAYPDYFDFVDAGEFTISTISWIGDFADPLTFLDMWTSGSNLNNSDYVNSEYDGLVRRALGETGNARYEMLAEAEEILLQDAIVLPISHSPSINLINLGLVDGWYPNPLDIHPFKFLSFSSGEPLPDVALRPARASMRP